MDNKIHQELDDAPSPPELHFSHLTKELAMRRNRTTADENLMKWKWGNVPIPKQYLAGLILGTILQAFVPRPIFNDPRVGDIPSLIIAAIGIGIVIWSVVAAGRVDIEAPQKLVISGPYARSRNPMMLAWTHIYVGIALVANSVWIVALLALVILFTHFVDIPNEEQFLENQFGNEYVEYRRRVRRYL